MNKVIETTRGKSDHSRPPPVTRRCDQRPLSANPLKLRSTKSLASNYKRLLLAQDLTSGMLHALQAVQARPAVCPCGS